MGSYPQPKENVTHQQVCDYLRLQYPEVMFMSDFAAGLKLTMVQASKRKRLVSHRGWPDLFIAESRRGYHGLFIELKRPGTTVYLKDGSLASDAHLHEQAGVLDKLWAREYLAVFAVGFDQAKAVIDDYLAN